MIPLRSIFRCCPGSLICYSSSFPLSFMATWFTHGVSMGLKPVCPSRSGCPCPNPDYCFSYPKFALIGLQQLSVPTTTFYAYLEYSLKWTPTGHQHQRGGRRGACRAPPARLGRLTRCGDGPYSESVLSREKNNRHQPSGSKNCAPQ